MSQEFSPSQSHSSARPWIIVLIVLLVFACACCLLTLIGIFFGVRWLWENGDSLFYWGSLLNLMTV